MWAAIAGALSVGITPTAGDLLRLLTLLLLVEASHEAIMAAIGWQRVSPADPDEADGDWFPWLPYSAPGSPSGRLARAWRRMLGAWRANRWTGADGVFAQISVNLLLAGVLSAYLGWPALWATLAVVALGAIHHLLGPAQKVAGRWVLAVAAVFVPWALAGALFGAMSYAALAVGGLFTLARGALIGGGQLKGDPGSLILADACQLAVAGILLVLKQPVAAGVIGILLTAQLLLQLAARQTPLERRLARAQPLVVLALLLAGWVLHAWPGA